MLLIDKPFLLLNNKIFRRCSTDIENRKQFSYMIKSSLKSPLCTKGVAKVIEGTSIPSKNSQKKCEVTDEKKILSNKINCNKLDLGSHGSVEPPAELDTDKNFDNDVEVDDDYDSNALENTRTFHFKTNKNNNMERYINSY